MSRTYTNEFVNGITQKRGASLG